MRAFQWTRTTLFVVSLSMAAATASAELRPAQNAKRFDQLAKLAIERVMSRVFDADTRIESIKWNKDAKALDIQGLRIANPDGFSRGDAIVVKAFRVEADPESLQSDEPVIQLIETVGATINAEVGTTGGVNIKRLLDNVRTAKARVPARPRMRGDDDEPRKRWRIEKSILQACEVNIQTPLGSTSKQLDDIEMDFLGEDGQGMTAREAMAKLMQRLVQEIAL